MQTSLTAYGYGVCKDTHSELVEGLRAALVVKPLPSAQGLGPPPVAFPVYKENSTRIYTPRYYGLDKFGPATHLRLPVGSDAPRLTRFDGTMRSQQESVVQAFMGSIRPEGYGGGLICLGTGQGKTITALHISSRIGKKTLVVCHKGFLVDQWRERIARFLPDACVGLIKQGTVIVEDKDIVIASLQSLAMREYEPEILRDFGLVIYDECHHLGAQVFSRAMAMTPAAITMGLSATLHRNDGLTKIITWFLGPPVFVAARREDSSVEVHVHDYDPTDEEVRGSMYGREIKLWGSGNKLNCARMINHVCEFEPRNRFIVQVTKSLIRNEQGRKVMVLSERREHLKRLEALFAAADMGTIGWYVGGMKKEALKESEDKDIILATTMMAAEGLDIPALNTLVLASPMSSIEQAVGRILRLTPQERQVAPTVIDIVDKYSVFKVKAYRRLAFYRKNKYKVNRCEDESSPPTYDFLSSDDD